MDQGGDTSKFDFEFRAAAPFRTTQWTVVLEAARPAAGGAHQAFAQLYRDYWSPLYAYVRRRGFSPVEAEDIAQCFFIRLLEKESLSTLQREGGRFRSFLLSCLENYLANEWDRLQAQKRGSGQPLLSLDAAAGEAQFALEKADQETPETLYEKRWVLTLLAQVMERLRGECIADNRVRFFDDVRPHLQGDRQGAPYSAIAATHEMNEGAVKVAVHRLRRRYGQLLRDEIARTVSSAEEVDDELRHLMNVVGR